MKLWKVLGWSGETGEINGREFTEKSQRGGSDADEREEYVEGERGELISIATYYHLSPYRCNGRAAPIINP